MTWCLVSEAGSSGQIRVKGVVETAGSSSFSPLLHLRTFAPISAVVGGASRSISVVVVVVVFDFLSCLFFFSFLFLLLPPSSSCIS